jgi:ATP-dependent 26S proteasome regulatory subunit
MAWFVEGRVATETDATLRYLEAELSRIDILIGREVTRWQRAGQDPYDGFRGLHLAEGEIVQLLARPFGTSWGQTAALPADEANAFARAEASAREQVRALSAATRQRGQEPRLEALATAFGLDRFDLDTLLICLAPALDLRYERLYAFLQDDVTRKRPTVNLVLDLLSDGQPEHRLALLQRFGDDAPLFKHHFLDRLSDANAAPGPLLGQALSVDPGLVTWLLGAYQPHAELDGHAELWEPRPEADTADAVLAGEIWPELKRATEQKCPLCVFYGVDETAQRAASRLLARQAGRPLLSVDLASVVGQGVAPVEAVKLALRDARLTGAVPNLMGWDACLVDGGSQQAEAAAGPAVAGNSPLPALLAELCVYPDLVVVAGRARWQAGGIDRDRLLVWLEFPTPAYGQREALWEHYLGGEVVDAQDVMALSGQFTLTTAQIRDAVASARDWAAQRGEALQSYDLLAAARAHSNPRLSSLARKITPRYTWDDIVLPADHVELLHEIVATVRQRPLVLEAWGVGRKLASSAGVTMLFSGEPGTGKTMAAEVMANELGLDLYKIDLSTVVSKYIGETEKNLERIFGEAQSSNAILFFDEADAIFGKRSEVKDAHDRYANIEISYLLQRMEAYEGVTILATNLRANLDEAFTRRLQFAVDFPFPDETDRLRIWQTLFPPDVPREPDLNLDLLARRFKLAGGNIRNILVSAAYLAASDGGEVEMKHLLHGTRRELQKMGRLVNERDLRV